MGGKRPAYQNMDEDAYDMAVEYTNAKELISAKKYHGKEGTVNMCEALTAMLADERQEGFNQGIEQGIEQGIAVFILDNQEEGVARERIADKLVKRFSLTEQAAEEYLKKYGLSYRGVCEAGMEVR